MARSEEEISLNIKTKLDQHEGFYLVTFFKLEAQKILELNNSL